jgi:hypothetical protein
MLLKKLAIAAGLAGTLGAASPAFADWYQAPQPPAPQPYEYQVQNPPAAGGYYVDNGWRRDDNWRHDSWRRRMEWERYRRWRAREWRRSHGYGGW